MDERTRRMICEWPNCLQPAIGTIHAQWTVVDFVDFESCDAHYDFWVETMWKRRVDNEYPTDVWVTWYEQASQA